MSEDEWFQVQTNPGLKGELRKIRDEVRRWEANAKEKVNEVTLSGKRPFSFDRFRQLFKTDKPTSFFSVFDGYLNDLLTEGRTGSYTSYKNARSSLHTFLGKDIDAHELTVDLLKRFEDHLLKEKKNKRNTVAIYMRTLKVIFNLAAYDNPHLMEFYPFARRRNDNKRYQIKTSAGKKGQALSLQDLQKFARIEVSEGSPQWKAKLLWLFSFYCQGMNFKDILLLKAKDVSGGVIRYVRKKTSHTELHESPITIAITDAIDEIINKLRNHSAEDEDYLFGFLQIGMQPLELDSKSRQTIKTTNKWLKRICEHNGLPKITTYWARHTYASLLKHREIPTDIIRELLGHSSTRTTEAYLEKLETTKAARINREIEDLVHQTMATIAKN
jgi:integrase/recombinase XerD